jgi:hypothetical protein
MVPISPEYARQLDVTMRGDLDCWATFWFWILIASTVAVVFGLLAELPEVWAEVLRPTWRWAKNFFNTRVKKHEFNGWEKVCPELAILGHTELRSRWKTTIGASALLGWILVAVGVAGEGIAEYFVNDAETELRAFDQAELTETQNSANSAAAAASLADTFSDRADATSKSALGKSKEANDAADNAQQKAGAAEASADRVSQLEARLEADVESTDLILTADAFGHKFRPLDFNVLVRNSRHAKVAIVYDAMGDSETKMFARKLSESLNDFKWQSSAEGITAIPWRGVRIFNKWYSGAPIIGAGSPQLEIDPTLWVKGMENRIGHDNALRLAFLGVTLDASFEKDPTFDENFFRIVIGR